MSDLIERQAAIDVVKKWFEKIELNHDICVDGLISLPSASGWILCSDEEKKAINLSGDSLFECSLCGFQCNDLYACEPDTFNYCPGCGAKMEDE